MNKIKLFIFLHSILIEFEINIAIISIRLLKIFENAENVENIFKKS
jgi:hypothetical protein